MAYTLLDGVNKLLKRVKINQGDAGALTSLTDSGRQGFIDKAVTAWNDAIRELYTACELPLVGGYAETTITLATSTREYNLATDLERLRWPLMDQTNGQYIVEYEGGYEQMRTDQPQPANFTGLPLFACINPSNGKLRMNCTPTATENGKVYNYGYDKRLNLSLAADTYPFSDSVVDALETTAAELWMRRERETFDAAAYAYGLGQAARYLGKAEPRTTW